MTEPADGLAETVQISQQMINAYADLSGDYNPLHTDPAFAAGTQFGSTIAHGPLVAQPIFLAIERWTGTRVPPRGTTIEIRHRRPARPGDDVALRVDEEAVSGDEVLLKGACTVNGAVDAVEFEVHIPRAAMNLGG